MPLLACHCSLNPSCAMAISPIHHVGLVTNYILGTLQEGFELCTRQNSFCLLQSFDLLIPCRLANFEIFHDEITTRMQLSFVICQLFQLQHYSLLVFLCLDQICLSLCFRLRFVDNVFALGLNRCICVLHKILISFLCIFLTPNRFCFHCFRI